MSARMRVTRAHTGNRRSHHALKEPRLSTCAKCNAQHLRHRMCPVCGNYRGREVVDVVAKTTARAERRNARLKEMGVDTEAVEETHKEEKKETKKKEEKPKVEKKETKKATKDKKEA